jgi:polyketide cyclase/dehydrase/lipid transport protein
MLNRMEEPAWSFQHSVECKASREFAWRYWTNIANWDDPPAKFELDGPFDAGSRLTTILPGQTLHSVIRDVKAGREATIEMQMPDAIVTFHWSFEELSKDGVQITQRTTLTGRNAKSFVKEASVLEHTVPDGMKKLAAAIERSSDLLSG